MNTILDKELFALLLTKVLPVIEKPFPDSLANDAARALLEFN